MRALDAPLVGDEEVEGDEAPLAGAAGADGVEFDGVAVAVLPEDLGDLGLLARNDRGVEQAGDGAAHEADAGPDDVQGYRQRDQGIEPQPPGEEDKPDADD